MVVFAVELLLKVIAYGFVIGDGAYLKSNWNKVDFIVVIAGAIDQIAGVFLPSDDPALVSNCLFRVSLAFVADFAADLHTNYSSTEGFQATTPDISI